MTPIYLVRHAHAVDLVPDDARPLSDRGREQVRALARFLRRAEMFSPAEVWHSPLVRARETAELLAHELKLTAPRREMPGLRPEDDPRGVAKQLLRSDRPIAVVGHEPHLSTLASLLVAGAPEPVLFNMKKGAVLALTRAGAHCVVQWHIAPAFLP